MRHDIPGVNWIIIYYRQCICEIFIAHFIQNTLYPAGYINLVGLTEGVPTQSLTLNKIERAVFCQNLVLIHSENTFRIVQ